MITKTPSENGYWYAFFGLVDIVQTQNESK